MISVRSDDDQQITTNRGGKRSFTRKITAFARELKEERKKKRIKRLVPLKGSRRGWEEGVFCKRPEREKEKILVTPRRIPRQGPTSGTSTARAKVAECFQTQLSGRGEGTSARNHLYIAGMKRPRQWGGQTIAGRN